jgi:uncharacterized protein YggE
MSSKLFFTFAILLSSYFNLQAQENPFQSERYIETTSKIDTLVIPDRIYLTIIINEKDTKGKVSTEELEQKMYSVLAELGINLKKQISLLNIKSDFRQYFLRKKDVFKSKSFSLLLYDSNSAGKALIALENNGISNVYLDRTEYSKLEDLKLNLRSKAVEKAKVQAIASISPLKQELGKAIYISDINPNVADVLSGKTSGIVIRGYSSGYSNQLYGNATKIINIDFDKIKIESAITIKFELL